MTASKLTQAQCNVMAAVGSVSKTGKNSYHGYKYASEGDLLEAVQPAMAKEGLAMRPREVEYTDTDKGNGKVQTDIKITYDLCHISGETAPLQIIGRGIDKEDKGMYKAMTGALKYLIRHTFLVPTNEHDPEIHDSVYEMTRTPVVQSSDQFVPPPASFTLPDNFKLTQQDQDRRRIVITELLEDIGISYPLAEAFCQSQGLPSPCELERQRAHKMVEFFKSDQGQKAITEFSKEH